MHNNYQFHQLNIKELSEQITTYQKKKESLLKEKAIITAQNELSIQQMERNSSLYDQGINSVEVFEQQQIDKLKENAIFVDGLPVALEVPATLAGKGWKVADLGMQVAVEMLEAAVIRVEILLGMAQVPCRPLQSGSLPQENSLAKTFRPGECRCSSTA